MGLDLLDGLVRVILGPRDRLHGQAGGLNPAASHRCRAACQQDGAQQKHGRG